MSRDRWSRRRSLVEQALDLPQQPRQLDRLGIEVVTPHGQRIIAVAGHGVSGQRHDRDMAGLRRRPAVPPFPPAPHPPPKQLPPEQPPPPRPRPGQSRPPPPPPP